MPNALTLAIDSMQQDMQRLATISQNMANSATPGYRREIAVARPFAGVLAAEARASVPDLAAGPLRSTGRPLDVALSGAGFFVLNTPHGPAYTRAGSFHVDPAGRLVDPQGAPVQGGGGDIVLKGTAAEIDAHGRVMQDGRSVGQLKVVQFGPGPAVRRAGGGALTLADGVEPQALAAFRLQPGHLEGANVKPLREMLDMTETLRHFEAAQKLVLGYEEQLAAAIKSLSEF